MFQYFKDSVWEFKHVSFPTKKETKKYLKVVIAILVAFTIYLTIFSTIFQKALFWLKDFLIK